MPVAYVNGQVIDGRGKVVHGLRPRRGRQDRRGGHGNPFTGRIRRSQGSDGQVHSSGADRLPCASAQRRLSRPAGPAGWRHRRDRLAAVSAQRAPPLECGVTTIRDCGSRGGIDFALRAAAQQGLCPTPRLVLSGLIICMTGGHGWQLGHEADGPDAVRRAARTQIKLGADNVKLIASGGIFSPGSEIGAPQFTIEEMRAAVEEARDAGKICCAHAHGSTAIKNAVKAGVDSVEHGYLLDDEGIQLMLERGTYSLRPRPLSVMW